MVLMTLPRQIRAYCLFAPPSFPQEGILENEFPFAAGKRRSSHEARYRAVTRFAASFDFDDLLERFAVKT
jgi:hypothetical protein